MPYHRRGKSLSDAITLEHSAGGGVVISSINSTDSSGQGLREGDELLGATIDFDQLSKDEVLKVLKVMEPYNDKVKVLTRNKLSRSLESLDQCGSRSPKTTLNDSYNKLYNAKIRKFMKDDVVHVEEGCENSSSKVGLKHDMALPRLGVDFGLLKTYHLSADANDDSDGTAGELTNGSNLNLPPLGVVSSGTSQTGNQVSRMTVDGRSPQLHSPGFHLSGTLPHGPNVDTAGGKRLPSAGSPSVDLAMPRLDRAHIGLDGKGTYRTPEIDTSNVSVPEMGINLNGGNITDPSFSTSAPKVSIEGSKKQFNMPKFKVPDLGLSGPSLSGTECKSETPDVRSPDASLDKLNLKYSKKLKQPDLNVDDLSSYVETPKLRLPGKPTDLDLQMASVDVPSGEIRTPLNRRKSNHKSPDLDLDVDASEGKLSVPKFGLSGSGGADIETPDLSLKTPKIKGDIDAIDINLSKADIKGPSGKYRAPKFTMPKFNLPDFQMSDFDGHLARPDAHLSAPHLKAGLSDPDVDFNVPSTDLDITRPSGKVKIPKVKGPEYKLKTPDMDVSAPKLKGGFDLPSFDLKTPRQDLNSPDVDINVPSGNVNIDADVPSGKFKMPKFKLFGTLQKNKDVDINAGMKTPGLSPKMRSIDVPDTNGPNMHLKAPEAPDVDIGSPKQKFKMPKLKMPRMDMPDVDASLKRPDLPSGGLYADWSKPKIDIDSPTLGLKGPTSKLKMPDVDTGSPSAKLKMPDFGLSGTKLKGFDGEIKTPDFDLSAPKFKGAIHSPDLNLDLAQPKLDLSSKVKVPRVKKPSVDYPDMDIDASSSKLQMPKFNFSGTALKGPDLDINTDLKSPNTRLMSPKMQGGINAPDLDLPKMDLKAPKVDVNPPDVNMDSPGLPSLKMPKINLPSLNGPVIDGNIDGPHVDINAPKVNLKGPKVDLDADIAGPSGKFKKPNLNLPSFGIYGPSIDGPKLDLKSPDFDISGPDLSGGLKAPDLNMPKVDIKSPKLDLNTPKLNLDMPSDRLKIPTLPKAELHSPDWNVNAPSGKVKMPKFNLSGTLPKGPNMDINTDFKSPDLSLKSPKVKGGVDGPDLNLPDMKVEAPKFDMNTPDVNIGSPKGKMKMPKLKMPKFNFPSLKGPEIDGNLDGPDIDVNAPKLNLKGPKADLDVDIAGPSGNLKKPNLNLPSFGMSGPSIDGPKLDLKSPDFDISGPDLSGGLKAPDLNMPNVDLKSPKLDLNTPKLNLDMPSGKLKMPTLPKAELHAPDWDVNAPSGKLKMPKFNLSGTLPKGPNVDMNADFKSPDLSLKSPKFKGGIDGPDLNLPDMNVKAPRFDMNTQNVNIGSPKGKMKKPKLKMPKFSFPSLKGPDIDGNLDAPDIDVNAPKLNLKGPKADLDVDIAGPSGKFKKPNLNLPSFGMSGPSIDGPKLDLKSPDFDISGPHLSGGLKAPDLNMPKVDLKSPKLDLNTPKLNLDMPSGKLKMPTLPKAELHAPDWDVNVPSGKLKTPDLNLSGTLPKGPNMDMNTDLNMKGPKIKGGINVPDMDLPNVDLKAPKLDVNTPAVDIGSPKAKFKMPKLKMPKVNLPGLKGPEIDGGLDHPNITAPDMNIKGSKTSFEMPDVDFGSTSGKIKMPHLKIPDVGFSGPNLDAPDFDANTPDLNSKLPKGPNLNLNSDLKSPDWNLKTPNMKGGINAPNLALPNMNLTSPELDMNTPDINMGLPDAKFKKPKMKMPKIPNVDIDGDISVPNADFDGPRGKLKMPSLNTPDLSISGPKVKTPDIDFSVPKLKGPGISAPEINLPDGSIKSPKLNLNTKQPDLGINGNIGHPDINFNAPQVKGGLKGHVFDVNVPSGNIQGPQTDLDLADKKFKLPSFKLPQFGSPDLNRTGSDIDFGASLRPTNLDISPPNAKLNVKPSDVKGNMTGPKVSAPNMEPNMPKVAMRNPHRHLKSPDLNIDDPSINFRGPSNHNHRSDITGLSMKMPDLDVDGDVRSRHTERRSHFDPHIDFNRSDLNIDDFTGKDHVLRARGSRLDLQASHDYGQVISRSGVDIDMKDPVRARRSQPGDIDVYTKRQKTEQRDSNARLPHLSQNSKVRAGDSSDGYYVTVFPTHTPNQKTPNRKYNTLGGLDFHPGNIELEVPDKNEQKGSTFFFSDLV